jgi:hypothetical protein
MLGIEPLSVQVLPRGTMDAYQRRYREPVRKINASRSEEIAVLQMAAECREAVAK